MKLRLWVKRVKEHFNIHGFVELGGLVYVWKEPVEDFNRSYCYGKEQCVLEEYAHEDDVNDILLFENDVIEVEYEDTFDVEVLRGYIYREGSCFKVMVRGVAICLDSNLILSKLKVGTVYEWPDNTTLFLESEKNA